MRSLKYTHPFLDVCGFELSPFEPVPNSTYIPYSAVGPITTLLPPSLCTTILFASLPVSLWQYACAYARTISPPFNRAFSISHSLYNFDVSASAPSIFTFICIASLLLGTIKEIAPLQSLVYYFHIIVFEWRMLSVHRNIRKNAHHLCIYDERKAVFSFSSTRSVLFRVPIRTSCNKSIVRRNFCRILDISYSFVSPL